jgi:hypothetical protein
MVPPWAEIFSPERCSSSPLNGDGLDERRSTAGQISCQPKTDAYGQVAHSISGVPHLIRVLCE